MSVMDEDVEAVAKAIYNTHKREKSPSWENASEATRTWVRKQAAATITTLLNRAWRRMQVPPGSWAMIDGTAVWRQ